MGLAIQTIGHIITIIDMAASPATLSSRESAVIEWKMPS